MAPGCQVPDPDKIKRINGKLPFWTLYITISVVWGRAHVLDSRLGMLKDAASMAQQTMMKTTKNKKTPNTPKTTKSEKLNFQAVIQSAASAASPGTKNPQKNHEKMKEKSHFGALYIGIPVETLSRKHPVPTTWDSGRSTAKALGSATAAISPL